ncbi:MAG: hypothetical protein LKJ25_01700 [Clostridia bacterium]|nr:hypothetical protein [Clostridia bacterium]
MDEIRKRDINLSQYNISLYAYRELEYFCLQYSEKKRAFNRLYCLKKHNENLKGLKNKKKIKMLESDINMIETAAKNADSQLYSYILKNVTDGISYEYMDVPCGRRRFYELRRLFFFNLYCMKYKMGNQIQV